MFRVHLFLTGLRSEREGVVLSSVDEEYFGCFHRLRITLMVLR